MQTDIERWDAKYRDANPNPAFTPDPILIDHAPLLDGRGMALDVACGVGQNAIYLAERGYRVVALDGSLAGLRYGREHARKLGSSVQFAAIDLDRFTPPQDYFSLILVVRYLNRALIPALKASVKQGGVLVYKTFNINHQKQRPTFHPDYLLALGELAAAFNDFQCLATNDSATLADSQTYWIGRR